MTNPIYSQTKHRHRGFLPGDQTKAQRVDRIIRVDHAGEFGAARIYDGQLAVLAGRRSGDIIRKMAEQERRHLNHFEDLIATRAVRPTALGPLWHVAGFALGVFSAALGERAAMACTEAVECVIDEHYSKQIEQLGDEEEELRAALEDFRQDEIAHRDMAVAHGAEDAPAYKPLSNAIRAGTRLAIWLSERV